MDENQDHLKLSKITRLGAGFIAVCGTLALAGALYVLFVKKDESVKDLSLALLLIAGTTYTAGYLAATGHPPRFLNRASKK